MIIKKVFARKIKDSRNEETIEVSVNNSTASSPSGKSTGKYETKPYMKNIEFNVDFLNSWNTEIKIERFLDLKLVEKEICRKLKLKNVKQFGANALFAFESAILKALAKEKKKELWQIVNPNAKRFPYPMGNVIGGGVHSSNRNKPEIQEFLIVPREKGFSENVKIMNNIYERCKKITLSKEINDEGALQADLSNEEILDIISSAIKESGKNVGIGIDVAASELYKEGKYNYRKWRLDKEKQLRYMEALAINHGVFSIEDPFEQEDFESFKKISSFLKGCLIVGDDLTATHIERLKKAIKMRAINSVIVKPNQNGSLIEVAEIVELCKKNRIKTIFSHRSGETLDDSIADYAFAFQADYIKCGIKTRWREVKLNRLIGIEKSH